MTGSDDAESALSTEQLTAGDGVSRVFASQHLREAIEREWIHFGRARGHDPRLVG